MSQPLEKIEAFPESEASGKAQHQHGDGRSLFQERLAFLNIDRTTREALPKLQPILEKHLPSVLDEFYAQVSQWPQISQLFSDRSHMDAAKSLQVKHWKTISNGRFDAEYEAAVLRIGQTHNRIGLDTRWYIGGYTMLVCGILSSMIEHYVSGRMASKKQREELILLTTSFIKAAMLDMDMAISTYFDANKDDFNKLLAKMTDDFDQNVAGYIRNFATATEDLGEVSSTLSGLSGTGQQKATDLDRAATNAANNVSIVASASEELSASILEINQQITRASTISKEAVGEAREAGVAIGELKGASDKIGDIVNLIQDIAAQTNLLALNATIEAARAGDAGKGFAVVASEVKSLATETAKATDEISEQIGSIQEATNNSVEVIANIQRTIDQIEEIATSISAAMEEQSAAMQEIVTTTQSAADVTGEVRGIVQDVKQGADETQQTAAHLSASAQELAKKTESLRGEVEIFLANLKTA